MPILLDEPTRPVGDAGLDPTRPAPEVTIRVVTQEAPISNRRRLPRPGNVISTLVALALAVALFLVVGVVTGLLSIGNPFATTTIDRSPPAVLKQLTNLSTYSAAQGRYQQTIDVEDDVSILPSFLAGEHTVFIAQGSVDARVDFSHLATDAVQVRGDHAVTVNLARPSLGKAVIDMHASRVASQDRGLLNRVGAVFSDNPNGEQRFYELAQQKLGAAARHGDLIQRAEANTSQMLQGLLGKVGFTDVDVHFTGTPGATG
jgi:hypothetical protein